MGLYNINKGDRQMGYYGNDECEICGRLGDMFNDSLCVQCHQEYDHDGLCPMCGKPCGYADLSDTNGICIKCEGEEVFFNTFDKGER